MKLRNYTIGLLVFYLQASCSGESTVIADRAETGPEGGIELELFSHLKQYAGTSTLLLPQGKYVGIYVAPYNELPAHAETGNSNIRCVSDSYGNLNPAGNLKLREGKDYSFYAYAPYKAEASGKPEAIPFVHGEDVLLCAGNPSLLNAGYDNRSVSLEFVHLTPQIQFVVKLSEEAGIGPLQSASVLRVSGFLPGALLDLNTGKLTPAGEVSERTDVKVASIPNEDGIYTLSTDPICFFATSNGPQTLHLRVTHEGVTYVGDINQVFIPGESIIYTIRISSKTELEITNSITDWINQYESMAIN